MTTKIQALQAEVEKYKALYAQAVVNTLNLNQREALLIMACEGSKNYRELKFRIKIRLIDLDTLHMDGLINMQAGGEIKAESVCSLTETGELVAAAIKQQHEYKLLYRNEVENYTVYADHDLACSIDEDYPVLETVGIARLIGTNAKMFHVSSKGSPFFERSEIWMGNVPRGLALQQGFKNAPFTQGSLWLKPVQPAV